MIVSGCLVIPREPSYQKLRETQRTGVVIGVYEMGCGFDGCLVMWNLKEGVFLGVPSELHLRWYSYQDEEGINQ